MASAVAHDVARASKAHADPRSFAGILQRMVKRKESYLLLLPTFALLLTFNYYPALSALYHSVFEWNGANFIRFNGLDNFVQIFHDPALATGFVNILKITIFSLVVNLTFPLLAAWLVFHLKDLKAAYFYRVLYVVPMVVPGMVVLMIWRFIYNPQVGLLNALLHLVGLPPHVWLGDFRYALYAVLCIGFPFVAGTSMLIYLAGFQGIPTELLDACAIDGTTALSRLWFVELPLIFAQIKLIVILTMIGAIQGFQGVLVMTNGGPGETTMLPGLWLYRNAMQYNKMGYACAIGTFLFIITLVLTYINLRYLRSSTEYAGA